MSPSRPRAKRGPKSPTRDVEINAVIVGCLELTLSIPMARSLKEKRGVVRRCIERVRNRFGVSVAEVGANDTHNRAIIGVAAVANDESFLNSVLDKILAHVEDDMIGRAEVIDSRFELVHI